MKFNEYMNYIDISQVLTRIMYTEHSCSSQVPVLNPLQSEFFSTAFWDIT